MMPFIIAITGPSGAGKSTLSQSLAHEFGSFATTLSTDDYYWGREKDPVSFAAHVQQLYAGQTIRHPQIIRPDKSYLRIDNQVAVEPRPIIIIEGLYALCHPDIQKLVETNGYSIFLSAPSAILAGRIAAREPHGVRQTPVAKTLRSDTDPVFPGYQQFIEPLKSASDLVVCTWSLEGKDTPVPVILEQVLLSLLPQIPLPLASDLRNAESTGNSLRQMLQNMQLRGSAVMR